MATRHTNGDREDGECSSDAAESVVASSDASVLCLDDDDDDDNRNGAGEIEATTETDKATDLPKAGRVVEPVTYEGDWSGGNCDDEHRH